MQIEIVNAQNEETTDVIADLIGKTFDSYEEMEQFGEDYKVSHSINLLFSFIEHLTEEEEEEEWNDTLNAAYDESERTGQPFDHIMGEILGGVR